MRHAATLIAILGFVPPWIPPAQAQRPPIELGARVRIGLAPPCPPIYTSCSSNRLQREVGTLIAWKADTLVIEGQRGYRLAVPVDSVATLEVNTGRRSRPVSGMWVGMLAGTIVGGVIGEIQEECDEHCVGNRAYIGAFGGMILGAIVGAAIHTDRWEQVSLDERVQVSLRPQQYGGFRVGASVQF